jgi:6-phosphogluconate dehydrogenase
MHIGLVGLGKMGGNMRTRMRNAGLTVVGYDRNPDVSDASSLEDMVGKLPDDQPRVVWVMVPAGDPTRDTVRQLADLLGEGDLVVDGGNSKWTDDQVNAELLGAKGIGFVDCGVSGGVWGLENGYALMCGGSDEDVAKVQPAFDALRPSADTGFVHAGHQPGAGHFAKMVHNGIEYAIMQSYAEGFELLEKTELVENVVDVFDSWRQGTVIRSWLLDLLVEALRDDDHLAKIEGYAEDSGEGRWTVQAAIDHAVPMNAIAASLFARFVSRQDDSPAMKAVAAMRNQFGGHAVRTEAPKGGDVEGKRGAPQSDTAQHAGAGEGGAKGES